MRRNPNFTSFDINPTTMHDAGVIACASLDILLRHGKSVAAIVRGASTNSFEYTSPDESYNVSAIPAYKQAEPDPAGVLGFFPNSEHRNYNVDAMVTVTTRHDQQYSSNPTSMTTRVVQTRLFVPGMDRAEGQWLESTATYEKDGRPDIDAEAVFLADATPSTTLAENVYRAVEITHNIYRTLGR